MKITACLLVKNEETLLPDCLKSLMPWVDEIVVADNGSTDRSKKLCEGAGALVVDASFVTFEEARNRYLEAASGDWVIVLDADERLSIPAGFELRSSLEQLPSSVYALRVPRYNYWGNGRWAQDANLRCWRNLPEIRYFVSAIHASVRPAIERLGGEFATARFALQHLDALVARVGREAKRAQYRRLIKTLVEQNPGFEIYLGFEYIAASQLAEAEKLFRKVLERGTMPWNFAAALSLGDIFLATHRESECRRLIQPLFDGGYPELEAAGYVSAAAQLAECEVRDGRPERAKEICRRALEWASTAASMWLNLAALAAIEKDRQLASECLQQALKFNGYVDNDVIYQAPKTDNYYQIQLTLLSVTPDWRTLKLDLASSNYSLRGSLEKSDGS